MTQIPLLKGNHLPRATKFLSGWFRATATDHPRLVTGLSTMGSNHHLRAHWVNGDGAILEWDYRHGHVEMYDPRGKHLGGFDAVTGRRLPNRDNTQGSIHRIAGYAKRTEQLAFEHPIPEGRLGEIRALAKVPDEDEAATGSYPLEAIVAHHVGTRIDQSLTVDADDWFLEPFSNA